jgi:uncharacterized membrane-anchored protein YhcB (DUF1043 family)
LDWDRYSYVRNNPTKYNDPSGHCAWDACILEGAGSVALVTAAGAGSIALGPVLIVVGAGLVVGTVIAYATNPAVREGVAQTYSKLTQSAQQIADDSAKNISNFAKSAGNKPLTKDEQAKIDHLNNDLDAFLKKHPDIATEAQRKANGEKLVWDHPKELEDYMRGVENDIEHLQQVRASRDAEAQKAIDEAINQGEEWLNEADKLLQGEK